MARTCVGVVFLLACLLPGQKAAADHQAAWNGQILPGAVPDRSRPALFLPYYVPEGDHSIDDTSPFITYSTNFRSSTCANAVNRTCHVSGIAGSTAQLTFSGTRVEWFGTMSPQSGTAFVFVDGAFTQMVDGYSARPFSQQRLFSAYGLSPGSHTITITVSGTRNPASRASLVTIDAFVVPSQSSAFIQRDIVQETRSHNWTLIQKGNSGVAAMQLAIVTDNHAIIIDKVEHNPDTINGHPAWATLYDLRTHERRPLNIRSNSFCAGGTWLSNGTLLNIGGNPVVEDRTGSADFGDLNGLQAIRMFNPCDDGKCDVLEAPNKTRLASARWYNSAIRLDDGSVMIIGGSTKGGWMNNETTNNPTIEYFPPKNLHGRNGLPIPLQFLSSTLNANLFPIAFALPDGRIFLAANRDAMLYDWRSNKEELLPSIPNGVRISYPMSGTGVLLPLSAENGYTPEVMLCGGSSIDDSRAGYDISSDEAASSQCSRLTLSAEGIERGWSVEQMPEARLMPDAVMLPDGKIIVINGAGSGIAGYGNVKNQVGQGNAANPVTRPVLYDPSAPAGARFSTGLPTSNIPRLYHSVASLTPNGSVMIAGSNPNLDRSNVKFGTEYRVEWLMPPYMSMERPRYEELPASIQFGKSFTITADCLATAKRVQVSLMDLGFITHGIHMNARLVFLSMNMSPDRKSLVISGPINSRVYPPGPAWLYLVVDGVPSVGRKVMVGNGEGPPVDKAAIENMLKSSNVDTKSSTSETSERRRAVRA